jgi:spermidine synthase
MDFNTFLTSTEIAIGLICCVFAIFMGVSLAKKQARAFGPQEHNSIHASTSNHHGLPDVTFVDYGDMRFLHLGTPAVQGSMRISKPFEIHLEYVQRMMAWLLFTDLTQLPQLHVMQMGLGAASLTKFCHHHLGTKTTAVELNPQVIATCRRWFALPDDNAKLQVLVADAGEIASNDQWHEKIDILQIDLYDQDAARPVIDSEAFYRDCQHLLKAQGCMVVNLFGHDASYRESLQKITALFGKDAVWAFKPTTAGNTIVLALRTARRVEKNALSAQAEIIQARWPLPATRWLKAIASVDPTMLR